MKATPLNVSRVQEALRLVQNDPSLAIQDAARRVRVNLNAVMVYLFLHPDLREEVNRAIRSVLGDKATALEPGRPEATSIKVSVQRDTLQREVVAFLASQPDGSATPKQIRDSLGLPSLTTPEWKLVADQFRRLVMLPLVARGIVASSGSRRLGYYTLLVDSSLIDWSDASSGATQRQRARAPQVRVPCPTGSHAPRMDQPDRPVKSDAGSDQSAWIEHMRSRSYGLQRHAVAFLAAQANQSAAPQDLKRAVGLPTTTSREWKPVADCFRRVLMGELVQKGIVSAQGPRRQGIYTLLVAPNDIDWKTFKRLPWMQPDSENRKARRIKAAQKMLPATPIEPAMGVATQESSEAAESKPHGVTNKKKSPLRGFRITGVIC